MSDKLDLILSELKSIKDNVAELNQRMSNMETKLQQHEDLLVQLIGIVKNTNEKITETQKEISALKDGQEAMLHIQKEQQKILERLSIRSIAQEADIAELRRIK